MVNRKMVLCVYQRGETIFFVRRVTEDVQRYYKSQKVLICLRTGRGDQAVRAGVSKAQRFEDYWLSLRLVNSNILGLHLLRNKQLPNTSSSSQTLHDALSPQYHWPLPLFCF